MYKVNLIYRTPSEKYLEEEVEIENLPAYNVKEKRWLPLKVIEPPSALIKSTSFLITYKKERWNIEKPTILWNSINNETFIYFISCTLLNNN